MHSDYGNDMRDGRVKDFYYLALKVFLKYYDNFLFFKILKKEYKTVSVWPLHYCWSKCHKYQIYQGFAIFQKIVITNIHQYIHFFFNEIANLDHLKYLLCIILIHDILAKFYYTFVLTAQHPFSNNLYWVCFSLLILEAIFLFFLSFVKWEKVSCLEGKAKAI